MMKFLIAITRGWMIAVGITLPKPEQEKAVAILWVVAALAMVGIVIGVSWAVLQSMASSMNYR